MAAGQSHDDSYGTPSKILAALLSPWVIILLLVIALAILHQIYYKPRLVHGYGSVPKSPAIFIVPPIYRRRQFRKDPLQWLMHAKALLPSASVFWSDVIQDYGKPVTIVSDPALISQFLGTEKGDSLSWDAPLRIAWDVVLGNSSDFGRRAQFHEAAIMCLTKGFEAHKTAVNSHFHSIVQAETNRYVSGFEQGDVKLLIDQIVLGALADIVFGVGSEHELSQVFGELRDCLESHVQGTKRLKHLGERGRDLLRQEISRRIHDPESYISNQDYLQWMLSFPTSSRFSNTVHSSAEAVNTSASEPPLTTVAGVSDGNAASPCSTTRNEALTQSLPDHLLPFFLQTHLLVSTCILWSLYSSATPGRYQTPDPLLLVRQTRKDILLGSTIIPKNSYIGLSPPLERVLNVKIDSSAQFGMSLVDLQANQDNFDDNTIASTGLVVSQSTSSFSPLLRDVRQSSRASDRCSTDPDTAILQEDKHKSKRGSWVRRYPQGHLISLLVGSISNSLDATLILTSSDDVKVEYGNAMSLWLPKPSEPIMALKARKDLTSPPASLYSYSRSSSAVFIRSER